LGNEQVLAGDDFFVARKGATIQILLWNYCHYTKVFAAGDRSALSLLDRYNIFADQSPRTFHLNIEGLEGRYKMTWQSFDRANGSALDTWLAFGAPANPTAEELEWLQRRSVPEMKVSMIDHPGSLAHEVTLQPHGVTLIEIQKVY
jgi:xylan 1,4-beta-xylosidase